MGKSHDLATIADDGIASLDIGAGGLTVGTDQLAVDSSGRVTMPYQPAFGGHKSDNIATANASAVTWTVKYNIGGHFNGTRFTAPFAGRYHFDFGGITHGVSSYFYIGFKVNGSSGNGTMAGGTWRHLPQTAGEYDFLHTSATLALNASDYVEACVGYNGGTPYLEQYRSSFSGHLIG